jgi:hypothetical protein
LNWYKFVDLIFAILQTVLGHLLNQSYAGMQLKLARSAAKAADFAPHSSDRLHAGHIFACGLKPNNEAAWVAIGLRPGVEICVPDSCPFED